MRKRIDSLKWRIGCRRFAKELQETWGYVYYAEKPADLSVAIVQLVQMARRLDVFMWQWLHAWLKGRGEEQKGWPRIWERYL